MRTCVSINGYDSMLQIKKDIPKHVFTLPYTMLTVASSSLKLYFSTKIRQTKIEIEVSFTQKLFCDNSIIRMLFNFLLEYLEL